MVCIHRGVSASKGVSTSRGCLPRGGAGWADPPSDNAGGMHPTGMHSCSTDILPY